MERVNIMQSKEKQKKIIEIVHKPIIAGSWHGKDANKMAFKRCLSVLATTAIYLFGCILLGFDAMWGRILTCFTLVSGITYYQYMTGLSRGENDAAYGEIIYGRKENGHTVPASECDRSFHPLKGLYAALVGAAPFALFALVYAFMAEPMYYSLGVLPAWTEGLMSQTEFATGVSYYQDASALGVTGFMRIVDRAMIMPFVNIASAIDAETILLAERLSPLLVLISPLGYALGYSRGQELRDRVNTGIKMGDDRKKKREARARRKRQRQQNQHRTKDPQQLV
ncbi:MAG: hypothetical protein IKU70_04455 [Clostridia bacterium]|nr:hypothetical protein [Clostridia bacterium]